MPADAMFLPLVLMLAIAPIAAIDILYFHIYEFRLYRVPSARKEMLAHVARGLLVPAGALVLASFEPHGSWFWVIGLLTIADFAVDLVDVYLEPKSRAPLGGLPPLEYMIHIVGAFAAGAITVAYFVQGWSGRALPTALVDTTLPSWLVWQVRAAALGGIAVTLFELVMHIRHRLGGTAPP
jgi:hypothetical protein